ncbi:MAG: DUF92 domain-containing protein [Terracidiphilus sp.]
MAQIKLRWQSKLVLLLVLPCAAASVVLQGHWWAINAALVAIWTLGLSLIFGLIVHQMRAATPAAAFAGAAITADLMFSTASFPYQPWRTALAPVLAVFLLSFLATRLGRERKEQLGTAERRQGRTAAQVAANLGVAAIVSNELVQSWLIDSGRFSANGVVQMPLFAPMLAALAEAAADTVSSEVGQVLGSRPRLITTLRQVEPGTDGAISLAGTLAGVAAAVLVALAGTLALGSDRTVFAISCAGGIFGLFFDSLLGATLERRGWLNNDAVNFLSTASAAAFALGLLAMLLHFGSL